MNDPPRSPGAQVATENPYAPPQVAPPEVVAPGEPTEGELRAFFGSNHRYYLVRWHRGKDGGKSNLGFNWAAFLLAGLWLGYRKMPRATLLFYGALVVESVLEEVLFVAVWGYDETPMAVNTVAGLAFAVLCGVLGNRWYLAHTRREIDRAKAEGLEGPTLLTALGQRGGTSALLSLGLFVAYVAVLFAAMLLLWLLFYPDEFLSG